MSILSYSSPSDHFVVIHTESSVERKAGCGQTGTRETLSRQIFLGTVKDSRTEEDLPNMVTSNNDDCLYGTHS